MKTKVSLIVQSNLSDCLIEVAHAAEIVSYRIKFVKYLINLFDMSDEIDPDVEYSKFINNHQTQVA
jgi:hypothetical protein